MKNNLQIGDKVYSILCRGNGTVVKVMTKTVRIRLDRNGHEISEPFAAVRRAN